MSSGVCLGVGLLESLRDIISSISTKSSSVCRGGFRDVLGCHPRDKPSRPKWAPLQSNYVFRGVPWGGPFGEPQGHYFKHLHQVWLNLHTWFSRCARMPPPRQAFEAKVGTVAKQLCLPGCALGWAFWRASGTLFQASPPSLAQFAHVVFEIDRKSAVEANSGDLGGRRI